MTLSGPDPNSISNPAFTLPWAYLLQPNLPRSSYCVLFTLTCLKTTVTTGQSEQKCAVSYSGLLNLFAGRTVNYTMNLLAGGSGLHTPNCRVQVGRGWLIGVGRSGLIGVSVHS